ncbi:N-acetyltransferase family protein [Halorussus gelatinilyticus]|uniref:N-acetyltransferase family protein n=1 Tax=Halorussus gelatinilyticus TaxID=2937524 RepID=A0A8U0IMF2_9EURY|nr:arsinothricin resistance N-acetyltransferase ArsN1 family B [Halorussus gelatinilyticus]UPW01602.1 N-acetyltransferase family protein [Halorussus gelatinilyticus]
MRIRLADEADAARIRAIYAPIVEETVISFEEDPPSEAEMADRIAETVRRYPWIVFEVQNGDGEGDETDGEIGGYAYAGRHREREAYRWSVDVSVYVAESYRRRGVGRGLYESLVEILRFQGFCNAYAGISLPNPASVALHESLGFEQVGVYESVGYKHGAWHDVGWWQRRLRERPEHPDPPRPLTEVAGTAAFETALGEGESAVEG